MSRKIWNTLLISTLLCFSIAMVASPAMAQVLEQPEKAPPAQEHQHQQHQEHHHLHLPLGEEKCAPTFTYSDGPTGPSHWPSVCSTGKMQSPIDIQQSQRMPIYVPKINYQAADLDIINDCNQYRILVKFPDNYWLLMGKKPYNLVEVHFRAPGENAVNGKRPAMSVQFVHFSPEGVFLIIEVPIVAGKENPVIKTIWQHLPQPGKESKVAGVKINAADLLPADRDFYRFPGSMTTPICAQGVTWMVMKHPIELSQAQIDEYLKHYHDVARPLQPGNGRPVDEPPLP